jgi:RNA polymerase sigma factor (sigma-70 family)
MPTAAVRYRDAPGVRKPRPLFALLADDRLVDHVRRGSHAAFEELYERHHRGMLAFCHHMLGSRHDAEEAVQQAFTAGYGDLQSGEGPVALKPWLYGIARHRCLAILRKRRLDAGSDGAHEGVAPDVTEEAERRSDVRDMLQGVSRLPEPQRTALVLFALCGHSQADVAAVLHCDDARVRALVYQARRSLLEDRRAQEIPCQEIRERLALGRGGALRRRAMRRHIKFCPGCAEFRAEVLRQRRLMGLVAPAVPSVTLKYKVLAAAGVGGGGGAGGGSAVGIGGSLSTAKLVAAALLVVATPVGQKILVRHGADRASPPGHVRSSTAGSSGAGAPVVGPPVSSGAPLSPDALLSSMGATREGTAVGLARRFEAAAGRGPAAGPARPPASVGAAGPAPPTDGKPGASGPPSAPPQGAARKGKGPEDHSEGGSRGKASAHRPASSGESPSSHGRDPGKAGHGPPSSQTQSPPPASPSKDPGGRDPKRPPCTVPSVGVGPVVAPPACPTG